VLSTNRMVLVVHGFGNEIGPGVPAIKVLRAAMSAFAILPHASSHSPAEVSFSLDFRAGDV
jgi:hypothetical protein